MVVYPGRIMYGEGSAYEVADDSTHRHIYHTAFLMQVFHEFDGGNINSLAFDYGVTERTMGRIIKSAYLYIMSHNSVYDSLSDTEKNKLLSMERYDRHGTGASDAELMVRRFLKTVDLKKASVRINDEKNTIEINISGEKRGRK